MKKDWRCRLGRHHYAKRNNPDAETRQSASYEQCTRCGKIHDDYPKGYGAIGM